YLLMKNIARRRYFKLWIKTVQQAREWRCFPDMLNTAQPRNRSLKAQSETGMRYASVFAEVQVPFICGKVHTVVHNLLFECVIVMYSLAAADYLPVTFGSNQICAQYCPWVLRVLFHVEGLDLFRVVHDEYREIEMICDFRFMRRPEVFAPLDVIKAFFLEQFNRIRICDTRERRLNLFEDGSVTAECLKVEPAVLKYIRDKIFHIFLL